MRGNELDVPVRVDDPYDRMMSNEDAGTGCREVALATLFLLAFAVVFMVVGLNLGDQDACTGLCETTALTLLYAGGPISAVLGVIFGGIWVAWPLEITLWVVIGFVAARIAARRSAGVLGVALAILVFALIYGLVLSQFVEIAI
jgi:hypothetical protein